MSKETYTLIAATVAIVVALINSQRLNGKSKKDFIGKYYFNQLKELYLPLYAVVAQSEYIRYRYKFDEKFDILEFPFLELKRKATKITASSGKVSHSVKQEETDVTRQDKKALIEKIFQKQEFSSQRLLKLAVAYRFEFGFYQDDKNITKEQMDQHQIYEFSGYMNWGILLSRKQGKVRDMRIIIRGKRERIWRCRLQYIYESGRIQQIKGKPEICTE